MNTKGSEGIVSRFRKREWNPTRVSTVWRGLLPGSPEQTFPLLCPAREADWLPGWETELVFTESGYAEKGCVFRTESSGTAGKGVWVFVTHDPPKTVEIVRFTEDILFQIAAYLEPAGESETSLTWEYVLTALTESGAAQLRGKEVVLERQAATVGAALGHYLRTGDMISAP